MAFGGFANELVDSQPPELQWECSICLQVVRDPHMVSCCSLRYCRTCIERVQRQGSSCPHCQAENYTITRDFQLERILLFKRGFCINKDRGCKWVGELKDAEKHVRDDCKWAEVDFPNQCGQQVLRCTLNQHMSKECPQRGKPCEFAAMGCESGLLTPTSLQSHLHEGMHTHLTLLSQKLEKMEHIVQVTQQTELRDLKTKVQRYETEITDWKTKIQRYETETRDLKTKVQRYETETRGLKAKIQTCERERNELKVRVRACEGEVRKMVQEAKEKQSKNRMYTLLGIIALIAAALYICATCTSNMKTHCPAGEGDNIGSWQNEPAINVSTPDKVDPGKVDPGITTTTSASGEADPSITTGASTPDEDPDPPLWVSLLVFLFFCWCCLYGLGIVK